MQTERYKATTLKVNSGDYAQDVTLSVTPLDLSPAWRSALYLHPEEGTEILCDGNPVDIPGLVAWFTKARGVVELTAVVDYVQYGLVVEARFTAGAPQS